MKNYSLLKKLISVVVFFALSSSVAMAQTPFCNKSFTSNQGTTMYFTFTKTSANVYQYKVTCDNCAIKGLSTGIYANNINGGTGQIATGSGRVVTISSDKKTITADVTSSTTIGTIYTPFYVITTDDKEHMFSSGIQNVTIDWNATCAPPVADNQNPVMGAASLASVTHNTAVINVAATDVDDGVNPTTVTKFLVAIPGINGGAEKEYTASGEKITITGLTFSTTYTATIRAKDATGNISNNSTPVTFTTAPMPAIVNDCSGTSTVSTEGTFTTGYSYSLKTTGSNVSVSFTLSETHSDLNATIYNWTTGSPVPIGTTFNSSTKTATCTLSSPATDANGFIYITCRFVWAGGLGVTKQVKYFVGDNCVDLDLADLKVDGTTVSGFSASKTTYDVMLPYGTTIIPNVTATPVETNTLIVTCVVTPAPNANGSATVKLTNVANPSNTKTYTINFTVFPYNPADNTDCKGVKQKNTSVGTPIDYLYNIETISPTQVKFTITLLTPLNVTGTQAYVTDIKGVGGKNLAVSFDVSGTTYSKILDNPPSPSTDHYTTGDEIKFYGRFPIVGGGLFETHSFTYTVGDDCDAKPEMDDAFLDSKTYKSAIINVYASDDNTNPVTKFSITCSNLNGGAAFELTAVNGQIELTDLLPYTLYNLSIKAIDNKNQESINVKGVQFTTNAVPAFCGKNIKTDSDISGGGSLADAALLYVAKLDNGDIEIILDPVSNNNPRFTNGISNFSTAGVVKINGTNINPSDYTISYLDNVLTIHPLITLPVLGADIDFTGAGFEFATDNQSSLSAALTFRYVYGANCPLRPRVNATPNPIIFTAAGETKLFLLEGFNITGTLSLVPSGSNFEIINNPDLTAVAGKVGPVPIDVKMVGNPTGNDYITISGGNLTISKKVYIETIGFSEYCEKLITSDGGAQKAYLTVTSSSDGKKIYFNIAPFENGDNTYWDETVGDVLGTVLAGGASPVSVTVAGKKAIAEFASAVAPGANVTFGPVSWYVDSECIEQDCSGQGVLGSVGSLLYTMGKDCIIPPIIYPFDVRGLLGTVYSSYDEAGLEMLPTGEAGVYSVTIPLPANTYGYKVYREGKAPTGNPRVFTLEEPANVTFYAKALDGGGHAPAHAHAHAPMRTSGGGLEWLFVCDAQDVYVEHAVNSTLTKKADEQVFVGYDDNEEMTFALYVKDEFGGHIYGDLVSDIGINYDHDVLLADGYGHHGYYKIYFKYATFEIGSMFAFESATGEKIFSIVPNGSDFLDNTKTDFDYPADLGDFSNSKHLKIAGGVDLEKSHDKSLDADIIVKMHYQIDPWPLNNPYPWEEFEIPYLDEQSSIRWENDLNYPIDVFDGISLPKTDKEKNEYHTITVWFEVLAFGETVYIDKNEDTEGYTGIFYTSGGVTTSVEDIIQNKLVVYPNPVKNELKIMNGLKGNEKAQIVDVAGKTVYSSSSITNNSIDVSNLANGIYFLKIDNQVVKFVKK